MTIKPPPFFSIITSTKNNLDGLKKTAQSVLSQDSDLYEWIIIDGQSQDGTLDILPSFFSARWISEPDSGLYDAMNKGIDKTAGNYLIFMNAGDEFYDAQTLRIIHDTARQTNADFLYGDSIEGDHNKKSRPPHAIETGMITHHQSMIYRRTLIGSDRYDTHYKIAADYAFTLGVMRRTRAVTYIPQPLCRFASGGLSQTHVLQGRKEQFQIRRQYGIPLIKNSAIFLLQGLWYQIRRFFPALYWRIKGR